MMSKMNTFTDFISCKPNTCWRRVTDRKDMLAIEGGSAGGLLMGAVTTCGLTCSKSSVSTFRLVDVINTMLDESLPLTVGELRSGAIPRSKNSTTT